MISCSNIILSTCFEIDIWWCTCWCKYKVRANFWKSWHKTETGNKILIFCIPETISYICFLHYAFSLMHAVYIFYCVKIPSPSFPPEILNGFFCLYFGKLSIYVVHLVLPYLYGFILIKFTLSLFFLPSSAPAQLSWAIIACHPTKNHKSSSP